MEMYKDTIFDLRGKTALITGGSQGIGKSISEIYAKAGADICITARNTDILNETVKMLEMYGTKVVGITFDHERWREVPELLNIYNHYFDKLDILVNNAGCGHVSKIEDMQDRDWIKNQSLLLSNVMKMCKTFLPLMENKSYKSKIINISSILGNVGREYRTAYCSNKGGVLSFTRALAFEVIDKNINVNSISPGQVLTPLTEGMFRDASKKAAVDKLIPLGRWAQPSELQGVALLLASEASDYIVGQDILIDGGWSIV